ncbi:hypothetical protein R9C00_09415 [Flammeovirgaceae bacterium SG7u.111]|nr:hypothetical protein [Flammeovirgaceae bacterium SG7u.132]WPO37667.1 hypothetical protein R9C00_09415 [Flammeovirgaceae bacterium SG7u.111]
MKEKLIGQLEKFDYEYKDLNTWVEIRLTRSLHVSVDFSNDGKCVIKERFNGWNILSGILGLKLKTSLVFNSISAFIFAFVIFFYSMELENSTPLMFGCFIYIIVNIPWFFYYHIKYETFKKQVMEWVG